MDKKYRFLKTKAIKLRKQGLSYGEIKREVPVAKSTLSIWLKNIPLRSEDKKRLYTKQVELLTQGSQSQKERRAREIENIIRKAEDEVMLPLFFEAYRLMGSALYWAEGSKTKMFEITNSDPHLILFMVHWIEKVFQVPAEKLKARLNIYPQQNDMEMKKFWSDLTEIPFKNFNKSYVKPLSKGYKRNNLYYGTIRIVVPEGTDKRHQVFGWIRAVLREVDPKVQLVQKKWMSLNESPRPINLPDDKYSRP